MAVGAFRVFGGFGAALALFATISTAAAAQEQTRNILLISIDTLRADHLSCYGYDRRTSPNIDAFARGALRFTDCMVSLPLTLPSHVSMLTGLHASRHGVLANGWRVPKDLLFISEVLEDRGFETCAFIGAQVLSNKYHFDQGFTSYREFFETRKEVRAGVTTDALLEWLANRDSSRPFFALLHYFDVHGPYGAAPPFRTLFCPPGTSEDPVEVIKLQPGLTKEWNQFGEYRSDPHLLNMIGKYDGGIAYVDHQIGRVLEALTARNLEQNTIVIMTADHGEGLGDFKNDFTHGVTVYQNTLEVPLIVRTPEMHDDRQTCDLPVCVEDIVPTIVDLCSLDAPLVLHEARSLLPVLEGALDARERESWQARDRVARSYAGAGENFRSCAIVRNEKLIYSNWTHGENWWMLPVDVSFVGVTRIRVFVRSPLAVQLRIRIRGEEGSSRLIHVNSVVPGQDAAVSWNEAVHQSGDGWVALTSPPLARVLPPQTSGKTRVDAILFNLGLACVFEGAIDDIQVEREGKWVKVESFDNVERPVLQPFPTEGPNSIGDYVVLDHAIRENGGRDNSRAEYISLRFPTHKLGKRFFDLSVDPVELVNIFEARIERAKELERSLISFLEETTAQLSRPAYEEMDDETKGMLRALGYLN